MSDLAGAERHQSPLVRPRKWDVFISYASDDNLIAHALSDAIEVKGFSVWLDVKVKVGEPAEVAIGQAIESAGAVVILLSSASLASVWVSREVDLALASLPDEAIFPIAVGDFDPQVVPSWLTNRTWMYLSDLSGMDRLLSRLVPRLRRVLGEPDGEAGTAATVGHMPPRVPVVGVENPGLQQLWSRRTGMTMIVGLGGVGKTCLAREYAHSVRNDVDFIWWLSGSPETRDRVEHLKQTLPRRETSFSGKSGLLIIDELDAAPAPAALIAEVLDMSEWHRVILTSRRTFGSSETGPLRNCDIVSLGPLSPDDSSRLLRSLTPKLGADEARKIVEMTSGNPLLLRLVARILQTSSVENVLETFEDATSRVIRVTLARLSPEEHQRLVVLSFCSDILDIVLSDDAWRLPMDATLFQRLDAIGLGVARRDGKIGIHETAIQFLRAQASREDIENALSYVAPRLPSPTSQDGRRYMPVVTRLSDLPELDWSSKAVGDLAELSIWQAAMWRALGHSDRAERLCSKVSEMAERLGGPLLQIRALNLQSALAFDRGNLEEAATTERRTAELALARFGGEHSITVASLSNLATTLRAQGNLAEAVTLLSQVVERSERMLPTTHPNLRVARTNLAVCLRDAGLPNEALAQLSRLVVDIQDGRQQLQEAQIRAAVLSDVGRLEEAVVELRSAVDRLDSAEPEESADVLAARGNLAGLLARTGRLHDAIQLQRSTVDRLYVHFGSDHPATLKGRNSYAGLLMEAGAEGEASDLLRDVFADSVRVLGTEHPDTLLSMMRMAAVESHRGDNRRAVQLYSDLVKRATRVLGPDHPTTLAAREEQALALERDGAPREAERAMLELLADLTRVLGPSHPITLRLESRVISRNF